MTSLTALLGLESKTPALPPGPPLPEIGQLLAWAYKPVELMEQCKRRYGDVFTIRFPGYPPEVTFSDPAAIKEIFTGSGDDLHAGEVNAVLEPLVGANSVLLLDGKRHLKQRKLLLPPFHGEHMHAYGETMREITDRTIDTWPIGRTFSAHEQMQHITLEIILRTVFGVSDGADLERLSVLLARLLDASSGPLVMIRQLQVNLGPLTPWAELMRTSDEIDRILHAEFARRRKVSCADRPDILSMLISARDENGEPMSDQELRDEMMTMLVAGHETTANALAWALYQIHANPPVLQRLLAELHEVVGDEPVGSKHLKELEFLDATIKETLRLDPVIPMVGRVLQRPMTIGGVDLPAGVAAVPCIYLTHRREDLYPDPERFSPERFMGVRPDPYSFFPFGGGIRRCIGMAFAMYEMKIVLGQMLLRTELELTPGYRGRITRRAITFTPERGMPLVVRARHSRAETPGL